MAKKQDAKVPVPAIEDWAKALSKAYKELEKLEPAGFEVSVEKKGKKPYVMNNADFAKRLFDAFLLNRAITQLGELYVRQKEYLCKIAQGHLETADTVTFYLDRIQMKVAFEKAAAIVEGKEAELKKILGKDFPKYVQLKYSAKSNLRDLALTGEESLEGLVTVKDKAPNLTFKLT